ncbi:DUF2628 domain-containing protein [Vibrio palustris]|uniref:DUF2628 domain-containing protein n=1 Tax=Vibrio palustris TaxID=1918946 RepID=A0A1R4B108_9VIBR|nr:DUF2628 domain-containing protein [Vibrio palustris]SJL82589.1 hypothetical protein VPAL9027_00519 [Vibrio palustris]
MTTPSINGENLKTTVWERRFELFDRLEADKKGRQDVLQSATYKALLRRERWLLNFNIFALFGGFFFYLSKGMYTKAGVMATMTLLWGAFLSWIEYTLGVKLPVLCYWLPPGVVMSQWANYDYYRKMKNGEYLWLGWPAFAYRRVTIPSLLLVAALLLMGIKAFSHFYQHATAQAMVSEDPIAIECGFNKVYVTTQELDLFGKEALCSNF